MGQRFFDQYSIDEHLLRQAVATFSMVDSETGHHVIANSPAEFFINTEPYKISTQGKYVLKYRFDKFSTDGAGKYFGEFKIDILHPEYMGKITVPTSEKLNIFITPSITKTDVIIGDPPITTTTTTTTTTTHSPIETYMGYLNIEQGDTVDEDTLMGITYPNQVVVVNPLENHSGFPNTVNCRWFDVFNELVQFNKYTQFIGISKTILPNPYQYYQNMDFLSSKGNYSTKGVIETLTIDGNDYWVFKLNLTAPLNYRLSTTPL